MAQDVAGIHMSVLLWARCRHGSVSVPLWMWGAILFPACRPFLFKIATSFHSAATLTLHMLWFRNARQHWPKLEFCTWRATCGICPNCSLVGHCTKLRQLSMTLRLDIYDTRIGHLWMIYKLKIHWSVIYIYMLFVFCMFSFSGKGFFVHVWFYWNVKEMKCGETWIVRN